jgi:TolB-like protein
VAWKGLWKTTTTYAVIGVAVVSVADITMETLDLPALAMRTMLAAVVAGLPITLLLKELIDRSIARGAAKTDATSKQAVEVDDGEGSYRQKLAVLPFANMNQDDGSGYLVDGIVEDLITEFSMIHEIEILSRQTCFEFRENDLDIQGFSEQFDVDYLVSGSIRTAGSRLRISVELADAHDGNVTWSNKYDRVLEDVFDIQDEIVRKITIALIGEIELTSLLRAKRKPTHNITSYEFLLKGKELHHRFSKDENIQALEMFDHAIKADEKNGQAYAWKACTLGQGMGRSYYEEDSDQVLVSLMGFIEKAIELNPNDFECHRMLAEVFLSMHDFSLALEHSQKAISINPNDPRVLGVYGELLVKTGSFDEGIKCMQKAFKLDPIPQGQTNSDKRFSALFTAYVLAGDEENCAIIFQKIRLPGIETWLLQVHLAGQQEESFLDSPWYKEGLGRYRHSDWAMEIDRFHLNNPDMDALLRRDVERFVTMDGPVA